VQRKDVEDWMSKCRRLKDQECRDRAGLRRHGSRV